MQRREHIDEVTVDGRALGGRRLRHERARVDAPLHLLHDVELGADDARVSQSTCIRGTGTAVDSRAFITRYSRSTWWAEGKELAGGLLAQHVLPVAGREQERRVALPAFELPHDEWVAGGKVRQIPAPRKLSIARSSKR